MSLTFEEIKTAIREREDFDTILDFLDLDLETLLDSGCLDELIMKYFDILSDIYKDGGSIG